MTESITTVDEYHQRTKHSLQKYAAGPEALDWDAQPDPFRHFEACELFTLPLLGKALNTVAYADLYHAERIKPKDWTKQNLAALLELSFGLSAWKQYGPSRWSLRCNPSSGNLHPTEAYVVQHDIEGLPAGVYHYRVDEHALELRCSYTEDTAPASQQQAIIGLSSVHWREAWKYGERAWRYVQLDVGHAMACLRYAAAVLGWRVTRLDRVVDEHVSQLLGLDRNEDFSNAEREHPDVLLAISPKAMDLDTPELISGLLNCNALGSWQGQANRLDPKPMYEWPVIDEITEVASKHDSTPITVTQLEELPVLTDTGNDIAAVDLIKQRRSAQAFDGVTGMSQQVFYGMLDKLLPRPNTAPWDCCALKQTRVHPVLFVHNVEGLARGVYALPRYTDALSLLQSNMRAEFKWQKPADCPEHIPLYLLVAANCMSAARTISCHQDIASDSAFSLAMLAEYDTVIDKGSYLYRQLYWEAGMLGQVLYMEAEANHLRGTGIGCFFDDALHDTLGITSIRLQDVYHFTVGMPIVDQRLISLPPYGHLKGR